MPTRSQAQRDQDERDQEQRDRGNGYINGLSCPVGRDWESHKIKADMAIVKVNDMNQTMNKILLHTEHLSKLDALPTLVDALVGKNKGDNEKVILISKILGAVICGLMFIIIFLLTGEKFGVINLLK